VSSTPEPITIVLARFEDVFARGLRAVIADDPSLAVIAADIEPQRLAVVIRAHRPRLAVLDPATLERPATVRELAAAHRETRLVLLAAAPSASEGAQLLAFGASAYLGKASQARDILHAIHLASRGLHVLPSALEHPERPPADLHRLTAREAEVLALLQRGRSNGQIAGELQIGIETVRTHARAVYRKLGVRSRRELHVHG